jgi:hypothetical protein
LADFTWTFASAWSMLGKKRKLPPRPGKLSTPQTCFLLNSCRVCSNGLSSPIETVTPEFNRKYVSNRAVFGTLDKLI